MRLGYILLPILISLLAGCASSQYQPGAGSDVGYYERRLKENQYEVSFKGDKNTTYEKAYDFSVLRALEIGRSLGYEYMLLTSTKDATKTRTSVSGGCNTNIMTKETTCSEQKTNRRMLPGYSIKVQYFERQPEGRFLPENLFLIRAAYTAMRHEYGMDKK